MLRPRRSQLQLRPKRCENAETFPSSLRSRAAVAGSALQSSAVLRIAAVRDMTTTVYGLDKCDTCRKARNWLDRFAVPYRFVDYRAERIPPESLRAWARQVGGWDRFVNRASTTWRGLPEARRSPGSDAEWTLLIKEYPALVRRPLVVLEDGTVQQGFTDNAYKKWFGR
jgi:Spx/MgsR family transcriptional regulator